MTTDESRRLGWWLTQARAYEGKSQGEVASQLGLTGPTLSRWEAGERRVSIESLKRLSDMYGLPVTFLLSPPETAYEVIERVKAGRSA